MMRAASPTFSIVICTDGRAAAVGETLASLPYLEGPEFEVCVVRGPTDDGIEDVLDRWRGQIKVGHTDLRNLSISRNIGIAMAAGDVVAFLDDDAVPEPAWLVELAAGFDDPAVACVGGRNIDHTGSFQGGYTVCNRMGRADCQRRSPADDLCTVNAAVFPYVQGTNSAVRRADLEAIGGFDEEYEFYLDETDVCCRLVDAGRKIRQLPNAFVHHRILPSRIRNSHRVTHKLFPVLKNKLYFSLVNNRGHHDLATALADFEAFAARHEKQMSHIAAHNLAAGWTIESFRRDVTMARHAGLVRGEGGERRLMAPGLAARHRRPFLPLLRKAPAEWSICPVFGSGQAGPRPDAAATQPTPRSPGEEAVEESRAATAAIWRRLLPHGSRVALAIYPDHWNVGDAAIWWGTRALLAELGVEVRYACDPRTYDPEALRAAVPDGPVLLLGGGNFGDVYGNEQGLRLRILADFADRTILQLPQSIWFRSVEAAEAMARLLDRQRDCTLLLRDAPSLAFARSRFPVASHLCPDAALSLRLADVADPATVPVVALWRRDVESPHPLPPLPAGSIVQDWPMPGDGESVQPERARVHSAGGFQRGEWDELARERTLRGCLLLGRGKVVITNRLHAHLLCLLLGKPHIVCDTVNGKIFSYRDTWHIDGPQVRFASTPEEAVGHAAELLAALDGRPA